MPNEKTLVDQSLKWLRTTKGGWWVKIHGGPYQQSGIPDILGCSDGACPHCGQSIDGLFFAFEAKDPVATRGLTKRQFYTLKQIGDAGGIIAAYRDLGSLKNFANELVEWRPVSRAVR